NASGASTASYWTDMPHPEVQSKADRGGVTAYCGALEFGQGSVSVLAAIVAEQLGLQPKDVRLVTADSDTTPIDLGSYSSRVTFMAGNAALEAARKMRLMLVEAVEATGRKYEDMKFEEACVLAEARFGTLVSAGSYTPPKIAGPYKGSGVGPSPAYSYSACVVDLDADARTGLVHVNKVWIAHDVGRAINPLLVEGQVERGVWINETPGAPGKIVEALRRMEKGEPARVRPTKFPDIPFHECIKVEPPPMDLGASPAEI